MERQVMVRQKRLDGSVMLRGQVLSESGDMVKVKLENAYQPLGGQKRSVIEVPREDVIPGSRVFGSGSRNGQRPELIRKQFSGNINCLANLIERR